MAGTTSAQGPLEHGQCTASGSCAESPVAQASPSELSPSTSRSCSAFFPRLTHSSQFTVQVQLAVQRQMTATAVNADDVVLSVIGPVIEDEGRRRGRGINKMGCLFANAPVACRKLAAVQTFVVRMVLAIVNPNRPEVGEMKAGAKSSGVALGSGIMAGRRGGWRERIFIASAAAARPICFRQELHLSSLK
jgi:hypothetical protein